MAGLALLIGLAAAAFFIGKRTGRLKNAQK